MAWILYLPSGIEYRIGQIQSASRRSPPASILAVKFVGAKNVSPLEFAGLVPGDVRIAVQVAACSLRRFVLLVQHRQPQRVGNVLFTRDLDSAGMLMLRIWLKTIATASARVAASLDRECEPSSRVLLGKGLSQLRRHFWTMQQPPSSESSMGDKRRLLLFCFAKIPAYPRTS